jgi:hypothetical protein
LTKRIYDARQPNFLNTIRLVVVALLAAIVVACLGGYQDPGAGSQSGKIRFDLSALNEYGLYGPTDGLRALDYEFCIPGREEIIEAVRAIDPTIQIHRTSRGRIGCSASEYLAVGSTHQPGYRQALDRLALLDYVARIEQSFGE